jgi:hypothetical protein
MAYLRLRAVQRLPLQTSLRSFGTTPLRRKLMGDNPDANLPDPSKNSSAAPNAKQPDPQAKPTRSTGIGSNDKVAGGKAGLHERGDKQ